MGTDVPGVDPAGIDPAAVKMRCCVGGEMPATHTHGATAEMGSAATHMHGAAAKVSSATAEMGATAATAEVSAAAATTDVTTATAAAKAAASGVSVRRQTQGKAYCGRACRDFPHDLTSSSGPNSSGPNVRVNARSPNTVPADSKSVCCNAHVARCTSHIIADVRNPAGALGLCGLNFFHTRSRSQE